MFGVTENDVQEVAPVVATYFRNPDLGNIGGWCLLPFCCGVAFGGSISGKSCLFEGINPDKDYRHSVRGETSEEMLAWGFHEEVAEWVADMRSTARVRLQSWVTKKGVSPDVLEAAIPYFALGIALETIGKGDNRKLLARYWPWIDEAGGSWLRLVFVAKILQHDADGFPAQSFCDTILRINAEPLWSRIMELFVSYQRF